jgi:hypothetical protein
VKFLTAALGLTLLVYGAAFAQSPYAGMQQRPIKALSEQQIADLKAGRGMGLALAAELNGYPGPAHLLQLADKLALSDAQRDRINQLFHHMVAEALPIGAKLIEQEAALDQKFAARTIRPEDLKVATAQIGATQAELRTAHLKYHLETAQILSAQQMQQYVILRGYATDMPMQHHHAQ